MKAKLFALFIVILMVGCGSPDSDVPEAVVISPQTDDPKTPPVVTDVDRNTLLRILDTGINADKIQRRGKEGEELYYKPNEESPYTGWIIAIYDDLVQQEYVMQVKDGKRDGLYCEWNRDGSKYRSTTYKKGVKNGLLTSYYNNGGKLLEINFKDGKEDGLMTTWYQNGQKEKEENFKEGKQDGVVTTWYENGQIKFKGASKDGKKDGVVTSWYENGQKKSEGNFKEGKQDGVVTSWYENGQIRMKRDYKTGKLMITEVWKPTGEKCPESNIVNGNGIELTYGPEGTAEERTTYKNGEVQFREDLETFKEVKEWEHEVFEGSLTGGGKTHGLQVILTQTPAGMSAEMKLELSAENAILRSGTWDIGDGKRILHFSDGRSPSKFFLSKRGDRFAFETEAGLTNDDGSLVFLIRNMRLSRKADR